MTGGWNFAEGKRYRTEVLLALWASFMVAPRAVFVHGRPLSRRNRFGFFGWEQGFRGMFWESCCSPFCEDYPEKSIRCYSFTLALLFSVLVRIQVGPPTPFPRHSCNLTLFLPPLNGKGCAVSAVREVRDEIQFLCSGLVALLLVGCQPMTSDVKSTDTCLVSAPTTIG